MQQGELASLDTKRRTLKGDLDLKALDGTHASLLQQDFGMDSGATQLARHGFRKDYSTMIALQRQTIALAKNQRSTGAELDEGEPNDSWMPSGFPQPAEPEWVPMPLAMQGPAAVTLKLLTDATCTEEQIDAVALLALSMQKR